MCLKSFFRTFLQSAEGIAEQARQSWCTGPKCGLSFSNLSFLQYWAFDKNYLPIYMALSKIFCIVAHLDNNSIHIYIYLYEES